jgi:hypothetical protein
MTESEIRAIIDRLIEKRTSKLEALVKRYERALYDASNQVVDSLDITFTVEGRKSIEPTAKNMRKATSGLVKQLERTIQAIKRSILAEIFLTIKEIIANTIKFKVAQGNAVSKAQQTDALDIVFTRYGYSYKTGKIIKGGYLDAITDMTPVISRVSGDMIKAIQAGQGLNEFKNQFRAQFLGATNSGYLSSYFNRWARDIYQQADAVSNLQLAQELGQEFAIYGGTAKDNTRCFCLERINNVYSRVEIESWNNKQWTGKIKGGNVLIDRGGYNCRHILNWVTEETANAILKARSKEINQYNENVC